MSEYICKNPISLGGKDYAVGDKIPDGIVLPRRAIALIRSNYIVEVTKENTGSHSDSNECSDLGHINIPIRTSNEILTATVSPQSVSMAFSILQLGADEAIITIAETSDDDALMLINAVERRKGVLNALKERHAKLAKKDGDADACNV